MWLLICESYTAADAKLTSSTSSHCFEQHLQRCFQQQTWIGLSNSRIVCSSSKSTLMWADINWVSWKTTIRFDFRNNPDTGVSRDWAASQELKFSNASISPPPALPAHLPRDQQEHGPGRSKGSLSEEGRLSKGAPGFYFPVYICLSGRLGGCHSNGETMLVLSNHLLTKKTIICCRTNYLPRMQRANR